MLKTAERNFEEVGRTPELFGTKIVLFFRKPELTLTGFPQIVARMVGTNRNEK